MRRCLAVLVMVVAPLVAQASTKALADAAKADAVAASNKAIPVDVGARAGYAKAEKEYSKWLVNYQTVKGGMPIGEQMLVEANLALALSELNESGLDLLDGEADSYTAELDLIDGNFAYLFAMWVAAVADYQSAEKGYQDWEAHAADAGAHNTTSLAATNAASKLIAPYLP